MPTIRVNGSTLRSAVLVLQNTNSKDDKWNILWPLSNRLNNRGLRDEGTIPFVAGSMQVLLPVLERSLPHGVQ